jgi:hypothetical protein
MENGDEVGEMAFLSGLTARRDCHIDFVDTLGSAEIRQSLCGARRFENGWAFPDPQAMDRGGRRPGERRQRARAEH